MKAGSTGLWQGMDHLSSPPDNASSAPNLTYPQVETENLKQKYEQLVQAEADSRALTKAKLDRFRAHRDREVGVHVGRALSFVFLAVCVVSLLSSCFFFLR